MATAFMDLKSIATYERPLDWHGPTGRHFTRFRAQDLDRSIISHIELVARVSGWRVAISGPDAELSYAQLWHDVCALSVSA